MGFIMDGLDAETYDRKYDDRQLISRIIGYFRPQLSLMLIVAVLVVLTSLMDTAFPLLIARSLDIITSAQSAQIIGLLVATILITGVLSWTFNFLRQRYTARSVGNVVLNLQQDAFAAIVARDMSFYDEYPSGKIVSRVTSDTEQFATVVTLTLNLLSQLLLFFLISPLLFLVANIGTTIVVYFGGLNVLSGGISAGEWFLFVQSIGILWFPVTSIASFWSQFQLGLSASERVFALIDAEPRVQQVDQQS